MPAAVFIAICNLLFTGAGNAADFTGWAGALIVGVMWVPYSLALCTVGSLIGAFLSRARRSG